MLKDARMETVYSLVRVGSVVCDIGTDHAIIPLELVKNGVCPYAVITDISRPSLQKGIKNVNIAGFGDKFKSFCADGTIGAEIEGATDFIIAGMGGELIVKILSQDKRLHTVGKRFILQPMTKAPELRRYLSENGFSVICEKKAESDGRIYAIILCEYDGEKRDVDELEAHIGFSPDKNNKTEREYIEKILENLNTKLSGLQKSSVRGKIEKETEELIKQIEEYLK